MKVTSLENLLLYIKNDIMQDDYDRVINLVYGDNELILYVFEQEIPIKISIEQVYCDMDSPYARDMVMAEVYAELLRCNIGKGWLKELDEICTCIEENSEIFYKLLKGKGEIKND